MIKGIARIAIAAGTAAGMYLMGAASAYADTLPSPPLDTAHGMFGAAGVAIAAAMVGILAAKSNNMRDTSLPQIAIRQRSYSLGRSQMAFWFFLIVLAFLYLFVTQRVPDVFSQEALMLMGISSTTGLGAITIDKSRDGPVKDAIEALQRLGLNSADDVAQLDKQIATLRHQQHMAPSVATAVRLNDAVARKVQAETLMRPYMTSGSMLRDLVSENGGATVHRLQVVVWTVILGWTFMAGCFGATRMPALSTELLALMGISGGTYFGFKAAS